MWRYNPDAAVPQAAAPQGHPGQLPAPLAGQLGPAEIHGALTESRWLHPSAILATLHFKPISFCIFQRQILALQTTTIHHVTYQQQYISRIGVLNIPIEKTEKYVNAKEKNRNLIDCSTLFLSQLFKVLHWSLTEPSSPPYTSKTHMTFKITYLFASIKILWTFCVNAVLQVNKTFYFLKFWNIPKNFGITDFIGFKCTQCPTFDYFYIFLKNYFLNSWF